MNSAVRAVLALLPLLAACAASSGGDALDPLGLIPPPPTIAAADASAHIGELVIVRTQIRAARVERGQAVLEPVGTEPGGFVIAIAPPVVGPTARDLVAKYDGQDVRAVGYISDLGNDLELLIGDPGRIRLADEPDGTVASEPAPALAAAPTAPLGAPPAEEKPAAGGPAAPVAAAAPLAPKADPACENARHAWKIAAEDAKAPLRELLGCLGDGEPRCKDAAARARIALAEVAASEERLRWVCGEGS